MSDCEAEIEKLLSYPLAETVASGDAKAVLDDDFVQVGGMRGKCGGAERKGEAIGTMLVRGGNAGATPVEVKHVWLRLRAGAVVGPRLNEKACCLDMSTSDQVIIGM